MPLAAVHLHVIILRAAHVHVRHTSRSQICVTNRKFFCQHMLAQQSKSENGVLAQLVERLNGIEEVRGSNPLGSTDL
jgi:hypothetical protein